MGNRVYIVDYDIPEEPARKRIQFYRDMADLKREHSQNMGYSTLSVFRTGDRIIAEAVYLLMIAHGGAAHVYYGEEITEILLKNVH